MYLGQEMKDWEKQGAFHTVKEICQQGSTWRMLNALLDDMDEDFLQKLRSIAQDSTAHIILSGAGTSAYIGNILADALNQICAAHVRSIPTTDIVSAPFYYFNEQSHGVVVSFGRSGNSPESIDAVEKIEQIAPQMQHIYVTCNQAGRLAKRAQGKAKVQLCLMPEQTHDESFVMTSSFSSMLLFTYGLFEKAVLASLSFDYGALAEQSDVINEKFHQNAIFTCLKDMERIVYLGSNNLFGAAQEAALKAVEMTGGEIITMAETSLGFRHGPKSIINEKTMVCVFVSSHSYTQLFDKDMINELIADDDAARIVIFAPAAFLKAYDFASPKVTAIGFAESLNGYNDALLAPLGVNYAQIIGLYTAVMRRYTPDNPCPTGQVNRVVQGVTLYDYNP